MENAIENMVGDFEAGKITRRDLVKGIATLSTGMAIAGSLSGKASAAPGNTESFEPWQQALMEGIANVKLDGSGNVSEAQWRLGPDHEAWLFNANGLNNAAGNIEQIKQAIRNVPKTPGHAPDDDEARFIALVMENMRRCGVIHDGNSSEPQALYEHVKKKVRHAMFEVSHDVYHGISALNAGTACSGECEDCKNAARDVVIDVGHILYFYLNAPNATKRADFLRMVQNGTDNPDRSEVPDSDKPQAESSHEW